MSEALSSQQAVLVHCEAGISRSATTVIAYLMKFHNMTLGQAFQHTKERRRIINPNTGFVEQLRRFEHTVREVNDNDAFQFVLYWLRNYYYLLKDVSDDEVRYAWTSNGGDLQRTWDSLYDTYEEKYLPVPFPTGRP
jgi:protein tyrosine phosphatase